MFTGLVEEVGRVVAVAREGDGRRIAIAAPVAAADLAVGDSVSLNGCCQTVVEAAAESFVVVAVPETLRRTNLGGLAAGDPVNLERPVRLSDRLGGNLVQGHVDTVGRVTVLRPEPPGSWLEIAAPAELLRYVAEKGSIAVDGVSFTVAALVEGGFAVAVIPHTWQATVCRNYRPGTEVNLEVDLVARYVERLAAHGEPRGVS